MVSASAVLGICILTLVGGILVFQLDTACLLYTSVLKAEERTAKIPSTVSPSE